MTCKRAPVGWTCSRKSGHVGPCAAHQIAFKVGDEVWVKATVIEVNVEDGLPFRVKIDDSFERVWLEEDQLKPRHE